MILVRGMHRLASSSAFSLTASRLIAGSLIGSVQTAIVGIIVRAIIKLGNEFGISVTAKGVETAEQVSGLIASGCQEAQGPRFGDAVPSGQIPSVLNRVHAVARL